MARAFQSRDEASDLVKAQDLMYEAWGARNAKQRIRLACRALEITPLCADAYVLLAEEAAGSLEEMLEIFGLGVVAGGLALGEETFEEDAGYFWGILETRPYMRARCGFAHALWASGEREEAVGHFQDMLRLNPNDNQGVRYILAAWYLELDRDDDLAALLEDYAEDGAAAWLYTRGLLAFRREGDSESSRVLLAEAFACNPHVSGYLLGKRKMPKAQPAFYAPGGEDEAVLYVADYAGGWARTPGALDWLGAQHGRRAAA
ncbi:MAG: hypothetical protein ACE5KF_01585 [Kiloniellaceae bacterium]